MSSTLDIILDARLVAIIRLPDLRYADALVRALLAGGVRALEFTLTNRDSINVIRDMKTNHPEFANGSAVIGAGTVITLDDLQAVLDVGAQFIVSPHTDPAVITACKDAHIPVMPGAYTPTEIMTAWQSGADVVKVFPSRALGPAYFKDVLSALPHLRLMPTGGVDLDNIAAYLASGAVAVGMGGNLVNTHTVMAQDWATMTQTAQTYTRLIQQNG